MEEKTSKNKKQLVIGGTILLLVTLLLLGLTYAYYRTKIIGNSGDKSVDLASKNLEITYQDGSENITGAVGPDSTTFTKTFSVKNTGEGKTNFSIKITGVENTFVRINDWTYEIKKATTTENNANSLTYENSLKKGRVPNVDSYLVFDEEIEKGATNYYQMTLNYNYSKTEDQTVDMGEKLNFKIDVDNAVGEGFKEAGTSTLLAAIGKDNAIAIKTLTEPGKEAKVTYELSEEGGPEKEAYDVSNHVNNNWTYGTGYEYDEETKKFKLTGVNTVPYSEIKDDLVGKYLASDVTSKNTNYNSNVVTTSGLDKVYRVTRLATEESYFESKVYYTNIIYPKGIESELAMTPDEYGTSYYFRGDVDNNYVTIGNTCWRIVRVLGNNTIKLVLHDKTHPCEESSDRPSAAFVGSNVSWYNTAKFGGSAQSALSDWLGFPDINIRDTYGNVIDQNANWCSGFTTEKLEEKAPSLLCDEEYKIQSEIALLSSDEVLFSGLGTNKRSSLASYFSMADDPDYYTLSLMGCDRLPSPNHCYHVIVGTRFRDVNRSQPGNYLLEDGLDGGGSNPGLRPSIVLTSSATISTGEGVNGTRQHPYVINAS